MYIECKTKYYKHIIVYRILSYRILIVFSRFPWDSFELQEDHRSTSSTSSKRHSGTKYRISTQDKLTTAANKICILLRVLAIYNF
jgi:hypothetical protein